MFSGGKGHCVLAYYDENSICHIMDYTSDYYDVDFGSIIKAKYVNGENVYVYAKLYDYDREKYEAFPLDQHKYDCYEV